VRDLGLRGIEIGTHIDANEHCHGADCRNLDHPSLDVLWRTAEELDAAIFVHPWDMMGKSRMPKYWLPWLVGMPAETCLAICCLMLSGVFDRFPKLRVAFAHGGGAFPFTIGRIEHAFHVRPDLVAVDNQNHPRSYLASDNQPARFYVDSLVHDPAALRLLIGLFGANRIALGSDYPFPLGETNPGSLIDSMDDISTADKAQLLGATAQNFLGLKEVR
jgi:aminocarboxymuconate-semialdehyde decarboxylase